MTFNSLEFALFFVIVYALYLLLRSRHRAQNRMLLAASCVFYGAWSWKFLLLLFLTLAIDYAVALKIGETENPAARKRWLAVSIFSNLTILGFFKYFNFFVGSFEGLLSHFGIHPEGPLLHIVLPVGISFYTFQTMSYTIDVYRKEIKPVRDFFDFALFVTYFPQLVAGPIERASHLVPQVLAPRRVTAQGCREGALLILWGFFQKIFVADNLANLVNPIFAAPPPHRGISVLFALYAFAFQIYCDFAGYSYIAIGLGKCMGFDIMVNFNRPYLSPNPQVFWQRWHISLSTWLRDYLYIPLGGNRRGAWTTLRNLVITMLLGGLWHGAAWTFVLWGAYHALLLVGHRLLQPLLEKIRFPERSAAARIWLFTRVVFFFHLVCGGWLFFRAKSLAQVREMASALFFHFAPHPAIFCYLSVQFLFFTWLLMLADAVQKNWKHPVDILKDYARFKWPALALVAYSLLMFGAFGGREFIYFQF